MLMTMLLVTEVLGFGSYPVGLRRRQYSCKYCAECSGFLRSPKPSLNLSAKLVAAHTLYRRSLLHHRLLQISLAPVASPGPSCSGSSVLQRRKQLFRGNASGGTH